MFGLGVIEEKKVQALKAGPDGERLSFAPAIQTPWLWPGVARAAKVVRRLRFFGHNAPASHNVYLPANPPAQKWPIWQNQVIDGSLAASLSDYPLDGRYDDLQPGAQFLVDAGPG